MAVGGGQGKGLNDFIIDLRRARRQMVEDDFSKLLRAVVLECVNRVVMKSPVDTGRFRGNWLVGQDARPAEYFNELYDKAGAATIAKAASQIEAMSDDQIIYVVNNLPYALALENGHSKQAPVGVVAVTVTEVRAVLAEIKQKAMVS